VKKPAVPVENQMEQSFLLEIVREERKTFRGIPFFLVLPELPEYHCQYHLRSHTGAMLLDQLTATVNG